MFVTTAVLETFVEHLEKLPSQNKFHRLTKISPTANRDSVRRGNIFSNEHIFPAEWDNVFLPWRWKILHDYFIHSNNNFITDLFIKGLKNYSFALMLAKICQGKRFFFLWISNSVIHFEYWFAAIFSNLIVYQNNFAQAAKYFIYERTKVYFFPG